VPPALRAAQGSFKDVVSRAVEIARVVAEMGEAEKEVRRLRGVITGR
jgi:hypothetical protein